MGYRPAIKTFITMNCSLLHRCTLLLKMKQYLLLIPICCIGMNTVFAQTKKQENGLNFILADAVNSAVYNGLSYKSLEFQIDHIEKSITAINYPDLSSMYIKPEIKYEQNIYSWSLNPAGDMLVRKGWDNPYGVSTPIEGIFTGAINFVLRKL